MFKRILFIFLLIPVTSFAQFLDDFEDQDITNWQQSNSGRWAASTLTPINGDFSLKHVFDNTIASNDQISCVLPATDLTTKNVCWRFRIRHSYAPSSSNNWTVFLGSDTTANQMIPAGLVNGYALAVNFTGSDDLLKLVKITNGIATVISTTTINWETQIGTSLTPAVEVVRFMNGNWEVRINKNGDFNNLSVIGSGTDLTYTAAKYFGIYYKYSASYDMRIWFDDFYFGNEIIDTIKPTIANLSVKSSKVLGIEFSERIDSASSINKLNYSVSGGIGNPDSIIFDTLNQQNVRLIFDEKFLNEQEYYIEVKNVKDANSNIIADTSLLFDYEYIKPLSVFVIEPNLLEIKFSREVDTISGKNPGNYFLNNGGENPESVSILETDSVVVQLRFANNLMNKTYYFLNIQDIADRELDTMLNAELSFLYLVPEVNDIVINEIMADPTPEVNLPNFEYVEIYNRTTFPIDITNWKIKMGTTERIIPADTLDPDSYLILSSPTAIADLESYGETLGVNSFPTITNSGTTISLLSPDSLVISKISFTTDWYNDKSKIDGGWSIERIDPLNTCSGITNWKASISANGGTPGTENSVYKSNIDTVAPKIETIEIISSTQIRLGFNESVDSNTALIRTNYLVNEGVGNPFTIFLSANFKQVDLIFLDAFPQFTNLVLSVNNIADECGNNNLLQEMDFSYYVAQANDILINEIMADPDPAVYLPAYEYIELYNKTDYNIGLAGWTITTGTTKRTLPTYTIEPNTYLILCSESAYPFLKEYGNAVAVSGFASISNSGQTIVLRSKEERIVSVVSFTDEWYKSILKADGGWSLEQIDMDNPCGGENNWTASVNSNGGTPGQQNSVLASNPDLIAPELIRATVVNNNTIRLFFNESIDSISTTNLNNYSVDNGIGGPIGISLIGPDYLSLTLTFSASFESATIYTIEISGSVTDCSGNEIGSNNTARFAIPVNPESNDLVINEILFNPLSGGYDFVELYNRSQKTIDLKNLRIASYDDLSGDYISIKEIATNGYLVFPGEYVVLTESPSIVQQHYYSANERGFVELNSLPSFNDDSGHAILIDQNETIIDNLIYDQSMHFALLASEDGVSLERINPDRPTDDKSNWHSASELVGFATPTYKNSQYKELTESDDRIKVYPEVFSPDNDGFEDVLDIQLSFDNPGYVANIKIYDSRGRLMKYLANNLLLGTDNTISWDGLTDQNQKTPKGIYVIYFEIFDLKGNVKKYRKPVVVAEKF